ncbi:DUF4397 domain-containing protein [Nesterenkonia natronophila]|uniref:DUF4397 domain-containing protein n=1 Tax=Nesterenkonia natronophila TaxID=2174932 RepID=A0A3A4F946_9MICC|nr:DUF4397 domain-containing protein [Nesterenkonia natronophila]RJN33010.1 DUF4397 domain-containing protein [Nesterenkonia natronophila]
MRKSLSLAATAGLGLVIAGSAAPAFADSHEDGAAQLSVLHAVPDLPVDVYVDGELTLDDFNPGDLAGPLELPAGDYEIAITAADAEDDSDPVLGPVDVSLDEGMNYTAAAHLDASGDPTVTPFVNDTSELGAGDGRLTVRHVAAAPEVDVWANGEVAVESLANPDEASLEVPASTVEAAVSLAGETDPVIGPADVDVAEGATTIVYAWGSAEDGNLALATQVIDGMHSAPDGVPAGNYQVTQQGSPVAWAAGLGVLALLGAGAAIFGVRAKSNA